MLNRKIEDIIIEHLRASNNVALIIDGARQVGKTYIVRVVGQKNVLVFIDEILEYYAINASKYDKENKLVICKN